MSIDPLDLAHPVVVLAPASSGDGAVDAFVGAAPAQVARERLGDRAPVGRLGAVLGPPAIVEGDGVDDETRCAVAALEAVVVDEGPLHRVEVRVIGAARQPLHRRHGRVAQPGRRGETPEHGLPVEEHRAGATHPGAADELRAGEVEGVAYELDGGL